MRRLATALLPLLLLGATACQSAAEVPVADPVGAAGVAGVDHEPPAPDGPTAKGVGRVGDTMSFRGRDVGRHLQVTLNAYVDPAVSVEPDRRPLDGTRWVAAALALVNVGGASYGSVGRMWAVDAEGHRYPSVVSGELTTGRPLVFEALAVGEKAEGWVVFEIPKTVHIARLHYQDANSQANGRGGVWVV
ncbi:DUF4352 domain-containing protein [Streptomyces sp. NPDC006879]|uniref:DUF4352 domain-containing protein n=1 Tax=Streptomyces sp. NPDC006879 TaxID=3364767 RepID=UPI00367939A4